MWSQVQSRVDQSTAWMFQRRHKTYAKVLSRRTRRAFTTHPHETDETYRQHLWFTIRMGVRFLWVSLLLVTHGLFPFLFTRTASRQIERIYLIMKGRIPKSRRAEIDALDFDI
jgi:hypothetical protein